MLYFPSSLGEVKRYPCEDTAVFAASKDTRVGLSLRDCNLPPLINPGIFPVCKREVKKCLKISLG